MSPDEEMRVLTQLAQAQVTTAPALARAYNDVLAMPYEFRAADDHVEWADARRRGYAACGEAAAYLAAAAVREGRSAGIELVTGPIAQCGPGYRHAVAVVDGVVLDPYAARACLAPRVPIARRFLT